VRIESNADAPSRWLLGAYYFEADETQRFNFNVPAIAAAPINDYEATAAGSSYALFGDATHVLGERWSIGGGMRLSRDEERVTKLGRGTTDPASAAAHGSWDDVSWRVGLELAPADGWLAWVTVSTGFKSGGVTTEVLPNGRFDSYGPEELLAYEAGVSVLFPRRLASVRASAFDYDFEDLQVRTIAVLEGRVTSVIDNAAAARIRGLDVSAEASLTDRWTFTGGLVWLTQREFVEFATASGASLSGNKISSAPEWSIAVSIGHRATVAARMELSADLDYRYRSELFFTKENEAASHQDGFGLLDLTVRFAVPSEGWAVFAVARNVRDARYFNQALIQSAPGYPARYEVGFAWLH
jgi:iron complex outermembrane receptor protein